MGDDLAHLLSGYDPSRSGAAGSDWLQGPNLFALPPKAEAHVYRPPGWGAAEETGLRARKAWEAGDKTGAMLDLAGAGAETVIGMVAMGRRRGSKYVPPPETSPTFQERVQAHIQKMKADPSISKAAMQEALTKMRREAYGQMYADGLPTAEIAKRLGIDEGTVLKYTSRGWLPPDVPMRGRGWAPHTGTDFWKKNEAKIREMHAAGADDAAISTALGVHPASVFSKRQEWGLPSVRPRIPEEVKDKVVKMRRAGHPYSEIAKELGDGNTRGGVAGIVSRLRKSGVEVPAVGLTLGGLLMGEDGGPLAP